MLLDKPELKKIEETEMTLHDFKRDWPETFQEAVDDIDWEYVFVLIKEGGAIDNYLTEHFKCFIETIEDEKPDPDEAYDDMRQKRIEGFDEEFREFVNKTFGGKK